MREPYIVRRRRTGIETDYLKRITELEKVCDEQKEIIKEFLTVVEEIGCLAKPKLIELYKKAKRIVGEK